VRHHQRAGRRPIGRRHHSTGQVAAELERGDLGPVGLPLRALVAQEEVEDVLAERLGDQLAGLHHRDGLREAAGQRLHAHRPALPLAQGPDVVLGPGRQLVALLDALEPAASSTAKHR
jgi:hypothetical protein